MINRNSDLSISRQAELLGFSRGMVYYTPKPISESDLALMRVVDKLHNGASFYLWMRACYVISYNATALTSVASTHEHVYLTADEGVAQAKREITHYLA